MCRSSAVSDRSRLELAPGSKHLHHAPCPPRLRFKHGLDFVRVRNSHVITRRKVLWESTTPRESEIWGFCRQHLATLATPTIRIIKCKQSQVYGVFDRCFHIRDLRGKTTMFPHPPLTRIIISIIYFTRSFPALLWPYPDFFYVTLPVVYTYINVKNCRFVTTCKAHNWHI